MTSVGKKGAKGQGKGVQKPMLKKDNSSKGSGKGGAAAAASVTGNGGGALRVPLEKRLDPSDGNGPFTLASFKKFHGEDLGESLWEQAGELIDIEKQGEDGGLLAEKDAKPEKVHNNNKPAKSKGKGGNNKMSPNNPFADKDAAAPAEKPSKGASKGEGKKGGKDSSKGQSKGGKGGKNKDRDGPYSSFAGGKATQKDGKKGSKGKGKKGASKGGEGKPAVEKRVDPSDGRGPFSHGSFLKYHGEEQGQVLWDQAGAEA